MRKILFILVLFYFNVHAQEHYCGAQLKLERYLAKNYDATKKRAELEKSTQNFVINKSNNITIPVVVHVVYKNGSENISDAQIQSQIDIITKDFTRTNTDIFNTPVDFLPIVADMQIKFCLAQQTPNGNPTNGIIRKQTNNTFFPLYGDEIYYNALGGSNAWDRDKYLNIWVCDIEDGVLGWSQLPAGGDPNTDGVVIDFERFGTIGTAVSPYNLGRTSTHEIGHWFNLIHLWGDNYCGDDLVSDTPEQEEANYGCKIHPSPTCSNNGDMFMNFMDYTNDACMNSFTQGQKNRVWSAIYNFRNGLLTSNGCNPATIPDSDAGIAAILEPNNDNISCADPIYPKIVLKNYGNTILNSVTIEYAIDGGNNYFQNWSGILNPNETDTILLSGISSTGTMHLFTVNTIYPNTSIDINPSNDEKTIIFSTISGKQVNLNLLTDNYGHETSWELLTENNTLVDSDDNLSSNNLYSLSYCLDYGCYKLVISDSYGDGFCCNFGNGFYEISEVINGNILVSGNQFSFSDTAHFCIGSATSVIEEVKELNIFPNPSSGKIYINTLENLNNTPIFARIFNSLGQLVYKVEVIDHMINLSNMNDGIYQIIIDQKQGKYNQKIIIQK